MASKFTVPIMSSIDSSPYVRGHSHTRSHQRSSPHSMRPFALPRIPSERLDPRSLNYDHDSAIHESDQKEEANVNLRSFGTNQTRSSPSLHTNGHLKSSRQTEATTQDPKADDVSRSDGHSLSRVNAKTGNSMAKTASKSRSHGLLRGAFSGILLPSPYILLIYLSTYDVEPFSTTAGALSPDSSTSELITDLLVSLILTSLTLGLVGAYGRYDRRRMGSPASMSSFGVAEDRNKASSIKIDLVTGFRVARRVMGIALPIIATLQLGCLSVSILMVVAVASGLAPRDTERLDLTHFRGWKRLLSEKTWTLAFSSLLCLAAASYNAPSSFVTGVMAVVIFLFFCHPPYLVEGSTGGAFVPPPSAKQTSAISSTPWETAESSFPLSRTRMSSPLVASTEETSVTLISGAFTAAVAFVLYQFCSFSIMNAEFGVVLVLVSMLAMWSFLGSELAVFGKSMIPLATGLATAVIGNALVYSSFHTLWQDAILGALAYMAVTLDVAKSSTSTSLASVHSSQSEKHDRHANGTVSAPTKVLLQFTEPYSLLHGIIADKDSRRIFYFMLLNLCFMLVQSAYGVLTGSLGLISDSIHMFFDCIALLVGLCAAVMSKWPPSVKYPYGYGKLDTLAGFGNGIFLMLISIEIVWEAIERLVEGADVSRTMELLIVSSLGLLVNLVGIMAFDHGHAHGHGHGGHSHSHGAHSHSHSHGGHAHTHSGHSTSSAPSATKSGHSHHHHGGDNMYGIYLHIMADALGSVAVVVSTLCVRYFGWSGFDPLASCAIAILIFASAVPLVLSSGQKLLLSLPGDVEYTLRDILAGVSTIRGVVGYTVPKFWLDDIGKKDSEHEHHHEHHDHHHHHHDQTHDHGHNHEEHSHGHGHSHAHSHHQDQNSNHSHHGECENDSQMILGVMHVIASQHADINDVRTRVLDYLRSKNMDIVVQVERDGDGKCWCGGIHKLN